MVNTKRYEPTLFQWKRKRGWLFYFFLIPLFFSVVFALFGWNLKAFVLNIIAFVLMYGTMLTARKGFEQEDAYNEAKLTAAPKIPYKKIAALMLAVSTFYAAYIAGNEGLFNAVILAALSFAGFWLYYGFDPTKDKLKDFGDISSELVLRMLDETEAKIALIREEEKKVDDRMLAQKVHKAVQRAQGILDALTDDPRDIRVARKFLVVYLDGIADVVRSYNAVEEEHVSSQTREKLLKLMEEVDRRFQKELVRLKANNQFELDVNIDTLKEQIKH